MTFDGQEEAPSPFSSGVPQGSRISPILYLIYSSALSSSGNNFTNELETSYLDDKVLLQGSRRIKFVTTRLQEQIDERLARAPYLNIKLAPPKS